MSKRLLIALEYPNADSLNLEGKFSKIARNKIVISFDKFQMKQHSEELLSG